jgi:D-glycerate 3-kinase
VLGVSGAQGSGKSTLAAQLVDALALEGRRALAISIDDFYLPRAAQVALAEANPASPYLEHRGYPGTHDVALGARTLDALRALGVGESMRVPRYDKGAFGGRGDRLPEAEWSLVRGPLELVVLEGWMLGFTPVPDEELDDPHLLAPNHALVDYAAWHSRLDALVHLDLQRLEDVVAFRVEAERRRRESGQARPSPARDAGHALSDEEAEDYVRRFLIAYRTWVPGLRAGPPIAGPMRRIVLGSDRLPVRESQ